jgi:fatty acid hydroxylase domain-containing protein 2
MIIYYLYALSYIVFSFDCYYKDCIFNTNIVESKKLESRYKKAIPLVAFNLIVVSYFVFLWFYSFYSPREFNILFSIRDILITKISGNICFYIAHKTFHKSKFLYKFHIVHHEFNYPVGIRAVYTHPVDYIFGNFIPLGITPFALGTDIFTLSFLTVLGSYKTVVEEHSDYTYNRHHLNHHKYYNCNYGARWIDTFLGTLRE